MTNVTIEPAFEADLQELIQSGLANQRDQGLEILVMAEQLEENGPIVECLKVKRYSDDDFDIDEIVSQQAEGRNLWRLKHFKVRDYRVVYCIFADRNFEVIHLLGIMPRTENYEKDGSKFRRILEVYDELNK